MSDKIPFEVLLPVALELYMKIPREKVFTLPKEEEKRVEMLVDAAENFAIFYRNLDRKLTEQA